MNEHLRAVLFSFCLIIISLPNAIGQLSIQTYYKEFNAVKTTRNSRSSSEYLLIKLPESTKQYSLLNAGVNPVRSLGSSHYIIHSSEAHKVEEASFFHINNKWKLSDNLSYNSQNTNGLIIKTSSELNDQSLKKIGHNLYIITSTDRTIDQLLADKNILYIGKESMSPKIESRVLDMNLNPNRVNKVHNTYPELDGEGIVVSVQEQAFDINDIDLIGRNIEAGLESGELNNHATEMATIIAGAGNSYVTGKGVVSKSSITSSDFADILPDNNSSYANLNVSVQNHSYGTEIENFYGALAEAYDQSAVDNPTLLHVFSSGNAGQSVATDGTYANVVGYANLTGNFKQSKNTLSVGSVDTVNVHPIFVSNGPAYDGRIKPEVVAYSAVGASNSAALTSGVIALMQDAYVQIFAEYPESALIKAILINEAEDVGAIGPDYKTGFGNIDAYKAVEAISNQQFIKGSVSNNESILHEITIPASAKNLKVTLVWLDAVSSLNAAKALVNDLDLSVSDGTSTYQPWVLNTTPDKLNTKAERGVDRLNNVEQVTISDPLAGTYDINITGFDVINSSVDYYIAYSCELADEFQWTFPTSSDNMPYNGESGSYFRWNTTFSGTATLEYSLDNGTTWNIISDNVDLSDEYFGWQPPSITGIAKARMTINNNFFETENFTISRRLNLEVKFNCGDSIMLSWDRDSKAINYGVYSFTNQNNFVLLESVDDTSLVLKKADLTSNFLKIEPKYSASIKAIGSEAFDYELLGSSCYLSSFSGEAIEDIIEIRLELALDYGVDNIVFERVGDDVNELISTVQSNGEIYLAEDIEPLDGKNYYRGVINFNNGEKVVTDTLSIYYLNNLKVYVYPNPLSSEDFLTVQLKEFESEGVEFQLIGRSGQLLYKQQLFGTTNSVILPDLTSGMYFYKIITPEGVLSDKVIILRE